MEIMNLYTKQSGVIARNIVKKYNQVIEDARFFVREMGYSKSESVQLAVSDWSFDNQEEKDLLINWFNNSFKG